MNPQLATRNWQLFRAATAVTICLLWGLFPPLGTIGVCDAGMQGPRLKTRHQPPQEEPTSSVEVAFRQAVRFYQRWVSPVGGPDRCGFRPSCSAYAARAISEQGALIGLLMTADRLTRCHIWKKPGADYPLLPTGKLYDPPSSNLLCAP